MIIQRCGNGEGMVSRIGDTYYLRSQGKLVEVTRLTFNDRVRKLGLPVEIFDEPFTDLRDTQWPQRR